MMQLPEISKEIKLPFKLTIESNNGVYMEINFKEVSDWINFLKGFDFNKLSNPKK